MSDIFCAKCGEPWDAFGVRHGDMTISEAEKFMSGQGCPACGFGTRCAYCSGVGRVETGCDTCFSSGQVYVRKMIKPLPTMLPGGPFYEWTMGYTPNVRVIPGEPYRLLPNEEQGGHLMACGMAMCPDCQSPGAEQGVTCPCCGGSGKFTPGENAAEIWETAVNSMIESSDEDPILILENM